MRPAWLMSSFGLVLFGVVLVACGSTQAVSSGPGRFAVATHGAGQVTMLAQATGTLEGRSNVLMGRLAFGSEA